MHKIVHSLAIFLVLYHTLVGCCWHHAHAVPFPKPAASVSTAACCDHSHDEPTGRPDSEGVPHHGDRGCDHGKCVFFVPPTDGSADQAEQVVPLSESFTGILRHAAILSRCRAGEAPPPAGLPPLRLHLANQILLI